jgi:hypothetical protein
MKTKSIARVVFSLMLVLIFFLLLSIQSKAASTAIEASFINVGQEDSIPLRDGAVNWRLGNTISTQEATGPYAVYLPIISNRYPPLPDMPVLSPIDNPNGSNSYSVSWNTAYLATTYVLEEDDNQIFSSPDSVYNGSSTSWSVTGKPTGNYYYRVEAHNSWGDSGWSNVQSTTVVPPQSDVYVENDTGCSLCYEVKNTGIGQKCFSSGTYYYGSFPVGTYPWSASTTCCGSGSGTKYYGEGTYTHRFWCSSSQTSENNFSGLQCELKSDNVVQPDSTWLP